MMFLIFTNLYFNQDGCDLVCRCGTRQQLSGEKAYRGIGDDQLRTVDDHDEDRDEHLLPM